MQNCAEVRKIRFRKDGDQKKYIDHSDHFSAIIHKRGEVDSEDSVIKQIILDREERRISKIVAETMRPCAKRKIRIQIATSMCFIALINS